jgi:hypothetical protein
MDVDRVYFLVTHPARERGWERTVESVLSPEIAGRPVRIYDPKQAGLGI